jgi:hypothetical protein
MKLFFLSFNDHFDCFKMRGGTISDHAYFSTDREYWVMSAGFVKWKC